MTRYSKDIQTLRSYAVKKHSGETDAALEQWIKEDEIRMEIFIGIENALNANNWDALSLDRELSLKKSSIKSQLQPTLPTQASPNPLEVFVDKILGLYRSAQLPPTYDMHLLVGFNCSVMFLILAFAMYINFDQSLEFEYVADGLLLGFKP